jgi:hypothetical protein
VVLNRRWAYRELFDGEEDAARAYDGAIWRLRPRDARGYVNFKDSCPGDVADMLRRASKVRRGRGVGWGGGGGGRRRSPGGRTR